MVKQGDIILLNFDPSVGHEQGKTRPALVISNAEFHNRCKMAILCPISHAKDFPMHIPLPDTLSTDGQVLCEHIRSMDIETRGYRILESVDTDFLNKIIHICKLSISIS